MDIIEKDIHRRIRYEKTLDDRAQKKNAPSTLEFKKRHGLGRTALKMGWRPKGHHRFLAKFTREYFTNGGRMLLNRNQPGGHPSAFEVAGWLTKMGYEIPYGISDDAAQVASSKALGITRRHIRKHVKTIRKTSG